MSYKGIPATPKQLAIITMINDGKKYTEINASPTTIAKVVKKFGLGPIRKKSVVKQKQLHFTDDIKVSRRTSRLLSYIAQLLEIDNYWKMSVAELKAEICVKIGEF